MGPLYLPAATLACLHSSLQLELFFMTVGLWELQTIAARPAASSQNGLQQQLPQVNPACSLQISPLYRMQWLPSHICHDWPWIAIGVQDWILLTALATGCWLSLRHSIEQWLLQAFYLPLWDKYYSYMGVSPCVYRNRKLTLYSSKPHSHKKCP